MFTVDERERVRAYLLDRANSDARVVAGAVVGSLAHSAGDRWSDLDLTFGVADAVPIRDVLDDFTVYLADTFDAVQLFDLPSGGAIYRVFLLPGCLELDLSFAPASEFGAIGPEFRLLFGSSVEKPPPAPAAAKQLFGYAVHHALHARICIERGRRWQAEYWISALRDHALGLSCRRHGRSTHYGRGFDELPEVVRTRAAASLVTSLDKDELVRALSRAIELLLTEADEVQELAARVEPHLRALTAARLQ